MASEVERTAAELAELMRSHNVWAAKVAKLQRAAEALEEAIRVREAAAAEPRPAPPAPVEMPMGEMQDRLSHLEAELQRAWRQLDESRAAAAEWERKARVVTAQLEEREREVAELRYRLSMRQE